MTEPTQPKCNCAVKSIVDSHPSYWNALDESEKNIWRTINMERARALIQSCTVDKAEHERLKKENEELAQRLLEQSIFMLEEYGKLAPEDKTL